MVLKKGGNLFMQYKQTVIFAMHCGKCRENYLGEIVLCSIYVCVLKWKYYFFDPGGGMFFYCV